MCSFRLPDTPFWALFRLKLWERWPRRRLSIALLACGCVFVLEGVAAWCWEGLKAGRFPATQWTVIPVLLLGSPTWSKFLWDPGKLICNPAEVLTDVAGPLLAFLAPAFAALALTPDRANGRLAGYRLAGLSPHHVLLASGLAALLPFAVCVATVAGARLTLDLAWLWGMARRDAVAQALHVAAGPACWVALCLSQAGILVSVSALCRRVSTAVVACYAVQFLLSLLSAAAAVWVIYPIADSLSGGTIRGTDTEVAAFELLPELLVLGVLLPLALRALRHADA